MRFTNSREHGADLGDESIRVRRQGERVLELVVEVGHPPRDRAAAGCEAERPAQDRAIVWRPVRSTILKGIIVNCSVMDSD